MRTSGERARPDVALTSAIYEAMFDPRCDTEGAIWDDAATIARKVEASLRQANMSVQHNDVLTPVTRDFAERMERAAEELDGLAAQMHDAPREYERRMERARLRGKAQGMRLAISYWRDAERMALSGGSDVQADA